MNNQYHSESEILQNNTLHNLEIFIKSESNIIGNDAKKWGVWSDSPK